jgi:anthranilate synthase component 2
MSRKILVIDNYDSFTYNLVHLIGELENIEIEVFRNDKITLDEIAKIAPFAIILSPGPCTPSEAGICVDLVKRFKGEIPIFGVCLGMQSIGQAMEGKVIAAPSLMHGKTSPINHDGESIFSGLKNDFIATRYHSLAIENETLPSDLEIIATSEDGAIMGLAHKTYPTFGVQFHPESISSQFGLEILSNFLNIADKFNSSKRV